MQKCILFKLDFITQYQALGIEEIKLNSKWGYSEAGTIVKSSHDPFSFKIYSHKLSKDIDILVHSIHCYNTCQTEEEQNAHTTGDTNTDGTDGS